MRSGSGRPSSPKQSCEAQHRLGGIPLSGCLRAALGWHLKKTRTKQKLVVSDSLFLVKLLVLGDARLCESWVFTHLVGAGSLHSRWVVRSHRHHRARPLSFNATLEAMRHHHSTVTLLTHRSPPPTTVRRRHRPVRFRRRPIEASVTVTIRGSGWTVLNTQRSLWVQTKTAHHDSCVRRCSAPQKALTCPRLSRFALHFAILSLNIKLTLP